MFVDRTSASSGRVLAFDDGRAMPHVQNPLAFDVAAVAPAGHYLALRFGFAFPVEEINRLPSRWVEEYTHNGYAPFDPLIRWVYAETGACRWSAMTHLDVRGILARAKAHGLNFGATVSVLDAPLGAQRSFGSFSRADREFTDQEIAQLRLFVQARHDTTRPPQNITDAEIEAMRLIKSGQRLKQIAFQLGVTEGAVKQRLKNARLKLNAKTSGEAISRATTFGLI